MEFLYSEEVQKRVSGTSGLFFEIPLRVRKDPKQEMRGALRAQRDWSQCVRPIDGFSGILGGTYGLVQVTIPECLPERVEIVSYIIELAYLCDDLMEETVYDGSRGTDSPSILRTFGSGTLDQDTGVPTNVYTRLQAQISQELASIDAIRGAFSMKAWANFIKQSSKTRDCTYQTLEEYIPACIVDTGELLWFGILTFGMALTIPEDEHDICMKMAKPAYVALSLTNDIYSWDVERKEAECSGRDSVFNSIFIIMKERLISEQDAKNVCVEQIKRHVIEFQANMDQVRKTTALSKDLHVYLEALLYSFSGNLAWSACCARYKA